MNDVIAYLVSPNARAHPNVKEELVFDKPHERPDWSIFPLVFASSAAVENASLRERIANLSEWMNRRVEVEQVLLDAANGKKPLPTAYDCRKLAMRLGDPSSTPLNDARSFLIYAPKGSGK